MGLLTKNYTFSNGAGNNVDATQINANFDTLFSGINGNIEAANIKDATITLLKLASEVKVIESVTHTSLASNYTVTTSEVAFITQNITPSAQRYCLFLFSGYMQPLIYLYLYDGATLLGQGGTADILITVPLTVTLTSFKQITSGAHTIYVKAKVPTGGSGTIYGDANDIYTHLTTIIFAF